MKGVFIYDGPMFCDEYDNHYGIALNDKMFQRYFEVVDELTIIIREKKVKQNEVKNRLSLIEDKRIHFVKSKNLSTFKGMLLERRINENIIEEEIKKAELVFVRLPSFNGYQSVSIAKKLNKKFLCEIVGDPWDAYWNKSLLGKFVAPYTKYQMRKCVCSAPYAVYVTNEYLQRLYPNKHNNINCSNVELLQNDEQILVQRQKKISEYPKKTYFFGTAAGLDVKFKGQQYVIKAIAVLKSMGIDNIEYQLIGSGSGSYLKHVAKQYCVEDKVKFLGAIKHEEVFEWMDSLDFYIQPSRQEGLPRSIIEAMSRGVPCLGANTAGIPELIPAKWIFKNSYKEHLEIALLIKDIIEDKNNLLLVSKENYLNAKCYEIEKLMKRRTEFFNIYKEDVLRNI